MYDNIVTDVLRTTAMDMLMKNGVDWYSVDMLKQGLTDFIEGCTADRELKGFFAYRQKIDELVEEINYRRGVQRSNRSYWSGGGFGIKGALVGKLKADMMNLGAGAIRSIGDSIVNANDRAVVQKRMNESYNLASMQLMKSLYEIIREMGVYIFSVLVREGKLKSVDFLTSGSLRSEQMMEEKTRAKAENIYQWYYNNNCTGYEAFEKLCACISEYPYCASPYINIFKIAHDTEKNLLEVVEYCKAPGTIPGYINYLKNSSR